MTENKKAIIEYPCVWVYKIIGLDAERMKTAVRSIVQLESSVIEQSRESKSGKYVSLNVQLIVHSDEERKEIFRLLGQKSEIKMVL
jgi:putative lipoic acid-binding regulatory protein